MIDAVEGVDDSGLERAFRSFPMKNHFLPDPIRFDPMPTNQPIRYDSIRFDSIQSDRILHIDRSNLSRSFSFVRTDEARVSRQEEGGGVRQGRPGERGETLLCWLYASGRYEYE